MSHLKNSYVIEFSTLTDPESILIDVHIDDDISNYDLDALVTLVKNKGYVVNTSAPVMVFDVVSFSVEIASDDELLAFMDIGQLKNPYYGSSSWH